MNKNLVICPVCTEHGTRSILGEDQNGTFSIMRFHQAYTKIVGSNFSVICGNCNEKTMIRKEHNERSNIRIKWFLGINTWSTFGTV